MNPSLKDIIDPLNNSTSPYHAVECSSSYLLKKGYQKIEESETHWEIHWGGKYFITRADSSICAFCLPQHHDSALLPLAGIGSHTDSPCLVLKSNPIKTGANPISLNLEVYGGALYNSWLDRDLRLSGMVWGKDSNEKDVKVLVKTPSWLRIPQLAIHLDRGVNQNGLKLNPQTEMIGVCADDLTSEDFLKKLSELTGLSEIYSWELYTSDMQEAALGGVNEDYLYSGRLDNLAMLFSSLNSFVEITPKDHLNLWVSFNHEEVGSESFEGARSNFLESVLKRVYQSLGLNLEASMSRSVFISADMAHAWHPGFPDRFDPDHHPKINQGPVLKRHANIRYGTSGGGFALIKSLCQKENIPHQVFHSRNDMGCGSTIGPACASQLGIQVIDLGNAMFSMHSAREMAGVKDISHIQKLFLSFYKNFTSEGALI